MGKGRSGRDCLFERQGVYAKRGLDPEVLILDLKMPLMSGLGFLTWIREHPEYRVIPTIIRTSSRQDPDIEKTYNLGTNTHMIKPSSFEELTKMVKPAPIIGRSASN